MTMFDTVEDANVFALVGEWVPGIKVMARVSHESLVAEGKVSFHKPSGLVCVFVISDL